ncbi:MAG: dethiobiotin synthase [Pseudomonadota bacterium]
MQSYFITATGTDIGKTWVACALCRHWRQAGVRVAALKPVMSGYDPAVPEASDAGVLLAALGQAVSAEAVARISPWRFRAPLSPDMAAAREGATIEFARLVDWCRQAAGAELVLIEGVGGCMVPLDASHTVRDWIAALGVPAVLVTGSYLGSLSHALTALAALRETAAPVAAIAVNESDSSPVPLQETAQVLAAHAGDVPVVAIARSRPDEGIARLARLLRGA